MARTRSLLIFGSIALFLASLAMLFFTRARRDEAVYLVYTAVFEVDAPLAERFSVGDRLIDARGKEDAGEILRITREETLREDVYGVYSLPDRVTLALTLGGEGIRKNNESRIGTLTPRVGERIYLLGAGRLEGICVKVGAV